MGLGGEHDPVAPSAGQRLADNLLRLAGRVHVRGVDEVDPGVERLVDDPDRIVVIRIAPGPEHHGAKAERADPDACRAKHPHFHDSYPTVREASASSRYSPSSGWRSPAGRIAVPRCLSR